MPFSASPQPPKDPEDPELQMLSLEPRLGGTFNARFLHRFHTFADILAGTAKSDNLKSRQIWAGPWRIKVPPIYVQCPRQMFPEADKLGEIKWAGGQNPNP